MVGTLLRLLGVRRVDPPRPPGYLTWAEVEVKYPGEWVLLDRPTVDHLDDVTGGLLLFHSKDRDEFDAELARHELADFAVLPVYDPTAEPIFFFPWKYEEWIDESTPAEVSSSSLPG